MLQWRCPKSGKCLHSQMNCVKCLKSLLSNFLYKDAGRLRIAMLYGNAHGMCPGYILARQPQWVTYLWKRHKNCNERRMWLHIALASSYHSHIVGGSLAPDCSLCPIPGAGLWLTKRPHTVWEQGRKRMSFLRMPTWPHLLTAFRRLVKTECFRWVFNWINNQPVNIVLSVLLTMNGFIVVLY